MDQLWLWLSVSIDTAAGCLDDLAAYLTFCGIEGLMLEDSADFDQFQDENRPFWGEVDDEVQVQCADVTRATFYVTDNEEGRYRLDEITGGLDAFRQRVEKDAGTLAVTVTPLQEEDWANNWKKYYQPFPVGERLYVVPEWLRAEPIPAKRTALYLNPGLIFGTGSHGTTRLCMEGVEQYVKPGDTVLDLGTGSGILAIAALRLGAAKAIGCDIDPKAADVAAENAAYNGIGSEFQVYTGDITSDTTLQTQLAGQYDLVLANIVADVIIPLSAVAGSYLKPDGIFLTSGIIENRAEEVAAALVKNGFVITDTQHRDGWVSYTARQV